MHSRFTHHYFRGRAFHHVAESALWLIARDAYGTDDEYLVYLGHPSFAAKVTRQKPAAGGSFPQYALPDGRILYDFVWPNRRNQPDLDRLMKLAQDAFAAFDERAAAKVTA